MGNNDKDNDCIIFNNYIIIIIFCIIIIILIISLIILAINIINYILFTVYCINDNATDYFTEDLTTIILGSKYKYRLLNYIKNIHDQNYNKGDYVYNLKNEYDYMSSDLYIHTTIEYYNYIVKLLLTIIFLICVGLLYNMFNIIISYINDCWNSSYCEFILSNIYYENTYVFYIIIIILLFIGIHSYIYTYVFNQNIYKDLYNLYGINESNYKNTDMIIYNTINYINKTDINYNTISNISDFLYNLSIYSDKNLNFRTFLDENDAPLVNANDKLKNIRNEGIIINNKFIIPSELENDDITNILFQNIYKTDIKTLLEGAEIEKQQELLANKIFLYLIYHYVITYNREDPYIIHKLNNIFLHTFEKIYNIYIEEDKKKFRAVNNIDKTWLEIAEEATADTMALAEETATMVTDSFTKENFIGGVSSPTSYTPTSAATAPIDLATSSATSTDKATANKAAAEKAADKAAEEKDAQKVKKLSTYIPIDKSVLLDKFNTDIKKMYDQINTSFTIKFLLPVNTKKENLEKSLHSDAGLILNYIYKYNKQNTNSDLNDYIKSFEDSMLYDNIVIETDDERILRIDKEIVELASSTTLPLRKYEIQLNKLKTNIRDKIVAFAKLFTDYTQENKTLLYINTTIYKINFYLAAEMMQVIIFILLVLFMLYKSKKYPFLEKYINMSIVYAILIVNEVISAILGII